MILYVKTCNVSNTVIKQANKDAKNFAQGATRVPN